MNLEVGIYPISFLIQNFIAQVGQKGVSKWKKLD